MFFSLLVCWFVQKLLSSSARSVRNEVHRAVRDGSNAFGRLILLAFRIVVSSGLTLVASRLTQVSR